MPPRRSSGRVKAQQQQQQHQQPNGTTAPSSNPAPAAAATPNPSGGRSLRPRRSSGNYAISSDSSSEEKSSGSEHQDDGEDGRTEDSQESNTQDAEGEDEEEEAEVDRPERGEEAGRSLRPRNSLAAPEGLKDYVDTNSALASRKRKKRSSAPIPKRRVSGRLPPGRACAACRESRRRCDRAKPRCSGCVKSNKACIVPDREGGGEHVEYPDDWEPEPEDEKEVTIRTEIRQSLEETKAKRDRFFQKYGDLFENLLTGKNYISKLSEKAQEKAQKVSEEKARIELETKEKTKLEPDGDGDVVMSGTSAPIKAEPNGTATEQTSSKVKQEGDINEEKKPKPTEEQSDHVIPYKLLDHQPKGVKATMKPYQLSGLSFLVWLYNNGANGILGDEMGLGKTLQTLSLFSYLTTYHPAPPGHQRPFLVVCPLSVLSSWISECKRWTPHLRVLRFHGPATERARLKRIAESGEGFGQDEQIDGKGYDVVVTSYEVFDREKNWFRRAFVWRYVVLDEGHKIKNEKTNVAQALQGLSAEYRLILTGTPLQNNLTELWALLHWLFPEVFTDNTSKMFSDAFDLTLGKNDLAVMDNARKLLELVMLRRMKESYGVNLGLPKKTEVVMFLPLTPMQRFWYKRLLTRLDKGLLEGVFKSAKDKVEVEENEDSAEHAEHHVVKDKELEELGDDQWGETRAIVEQAVEDSKTDQKWRKLMNLLMQLRKCCDHPYLLPNAEPPEAENEHRDPSHVVLASSKLIFLDKLIDQLCLKENKKVLIFSGFTRMLDVCEDLMHYKGGDGAKFKYGRLDGTTPRARRNLGIRLFNSDPDYKVMLISTRAGGLGINLASASNVVMLESDWNPQADLQAQARAHRIGQTQPVTIYRLITQGTVEEQMMGRIRKKLYLSAKVTESMRDIHTSTSSAGLSGDAEDNMPTLSTGQLMSLVRSGSRAIARPEIDPAEMLTWSWEDTVSKCRDYQDKLESLDKDKHVTESQDEEERRWLSEMERVETRVFEGKKHEKSSGPESNSVIAADWSREQRRAGMERVVMVDGHPVLKETIGNNEWEAVKTFAGRDPRLAEPAKRKRKQIEHQDYCQVCFDGGILHTCSGCPRTYHHACLPDDFKPKLKAKGGHFYCPQHQCAECEQKTTNAGGMLYRCRWCESAYCEDCLDWDNSELLGETLPEFELLDFGAIEQAFWIKCANCIALHLEDPEAVALCAGLEEEWEEERIKREKTAAEREAREAAEREEAATLTMDGTTVEGSEVNTPVGEMVNGAPSVALPNPTVNGIGIAGTKRKRTATMTPPVYTPPGRGSRGRGRGRGRGSGTPSSRGGRSKVSTPATDFSMGGLLAEDMAAAAAAREGMATGSTGIGGGLGSGLVAIAPKPSPFAPVRGATQSSPAPPAPVGANSFAAAGSMVAAAQNGNGVPANSAAAPVSASLAPAPTPTPATTTTLPVAKKMKVIEID